MTQPHSRSRKRRLLLGLLAIVLSAFTWWEIAALMRLLGSPVRPCGCTRRDTGNPPGHIHMPGETSAGSRGATLPSWLPASPKQTWPQRAHVIMRPFSLSQNTRLPVAISHPKESTSSPAPTKQEDEPASNVSSALHLAHYLILRSHSLPMGPPE